MSGQVDPSGVRPGAVLDAIRRRGGQPTILEVLAELRSRGIPIDHEVLRAILAALARRGRVLERPGDRWALGGTGTLPVQLPLFGESPSTPGTSGAEEAARTAAPGQVGSSPSAREGRTSQGSPPDVRSPHPLPRREVSQTATAQTTTAHGLLPTVTVRGGGPADVRAGMGSSGAAARPPGPSPTGSGAVLHGRYRVVRVLGEGGMGRVFEAEDLELSRMVALKTVNSPSASAVQALENELRLLASIDRPDYFPRVYEGFFHHGLLYVPMDRIEGRDLATYIRDVGAVGLDFTRIASIFEAICYRIQYLHEYPPHQILFRDLKPSNVMITGPSLEVRLVDFGIAAKADSTRSPGAGTEGFWAPEARHDGLYSVRSDVFALGQLLRCLLWASPQPLPAEDAGPVPFAVDRRIPPGVDRAAADMAHAGRDSRPGSALLALDAFRRASSGGGGVSTAVGGTTCRDCGFLSSGEFHICPGCGRWLTVPRRVASAVRDWQRVERRFFDLGIGQIRPSRTAFSGAGRDLLEAAASVARTRGYTELTCLPSVKIDNYPYQRSAALRVLRDFQGRGILADEVGLGKTIEAGLVLKEYWVRGEAKRALVVVPPALREQWRTELVEKLGFQPDEVVIYGSDGGTRDMGCLDRPRVVLIVGLHLARQQLRDQLLRRSWDVLIADEAHHAKRHSKDRMNRLAELFARLNAKRTVFLTATPAQNDLRELFYLVSLVRPGLVGADAWQFTQRFGGAHGSWVVRDRDELAALLQRVVVRNRRAEVYKAFPKRTARTWQLPLTPAEGEAYRGIVAYGQRTGMNPLALTERTRQFCTSYRHFLDETPVEALRAAVRPLAGQSHFKLRTFMDVVVPSLAGESKILVFSRFLASQNEIFTALRRAGHEVALAGDSPAERVKGVKRFRSEPDLRFLVCGDALGEGVNLQFCRCMVNFDLPWNPQRIEQRIGRIQRLGSEYREVLVVNLAAKETIEDLVILYVEKKLRMFEDVFGSVEAVLGQLAEGESIEGFIREALRCGREGQYDPQVAARGAKSIEDAREAAQQGGDFAGILDLFEELGSDPGGAPCP